MSASGGQGLDWGVERLHLQLSQVMPNLAVEVVSKIASTNTALLERARVTNRLSGDFDMNGLRRLPAGTAFGRRNADYQPCLLVAEQQTHGRGRQGRSWQSQPGASLTFSLAIPLAPADWSGFSLAVGVALAEALDPAGARDATGSSPARPWIGIKWPNDLWLMPPAGAAGSGRKLGGLLIETVSAGALKLAVVGVGLNVLPMCLDEEQASSGFACLHELDSTATAPSVLARVALPLVEALQQFARNGLAGFAERFAARDVLRGLQVVAGVAVGGEAGAVAADGGISGVADGVAANGALRLITADGLREVISGEVSVRLAGAAGETAC
jgi:BirA family biotin operon repressor/biotin-[acetyl-CoA-carboxylase] ligase